MKEPAKSIQEQPLPAIDYRPERRADVKFCKIDGEIVVVDRRNGVVHQLNPAASLIWDCCDGQSTITDIAGHLVTAYEVDRKTATMDVTKVVADLHRLGLLVPSHKEETMDRTRSAGIQD